MIEMCHLKNVAIFFQKILSFMLSRKIINIQILLHKSTPSLVKSSTHFFETFSLDKFLIAYRNFKFRFYLDYGFMWDQLLKDYFEIFQSCTLFIFKQSAGLCGTSC